MKAVVQRVKQTSLRVDGELISEIPFGLTVFLGVKVGDTEKEAAYLAKKIAALRIFEDENGKMNLSVKDVGGEILMVSQFTLYGDASHGNRPSFTLAERPERAEVLYEYAVKEVSDARPNLCRWYHNGTWRLCRGAIRQRGPSSRMPP